jgi:signal transduction histidine kinase
MVWYPGWLIQYNPATLESRLFTTKEGLPNNIIWGILEDNAGNLWLSTNSGLSRFNINKNIFKNYNFADGLQSNEFNRGAYFGNKKELLFGGMNGFNSFEPANISDSKFIPPVYVTTFRVFDNLLSLNNPVPDSQRIELAYSQNFFSFEFVALNFSSPEKNQYAYKLEGFDREWHTVSALRRYASYTNLDPGEYRLLVRGSNNDGEWNMAGHSLFILIKPPFWKTWWFRISALLFFAGIAAVIYNYRIRKLRELDQMRLRIASDLHDEVGSDLGGIALISQRLCRHDSLPAAVSSDLNEIKKASFQTAEKLRDIIWFVNPEHDLSEHLVLRLKDLAGRLLKESEFTFTVGEKVSFQNLNLEFRRQIFLIFKEVLHNIVKHACAENVRIIMEQKNKILKIEISDDGKGFSTNPAECPGGNARGMGIKNIKRRAQAIGAELNISSSKDRGTTVVLLLRMP